jgi:hypothetical protein
LFGNDFRIRISNSNGQYWDDSDGDFTIATGTSITVISPNGGESWQAGTNQTIHWSYIGDPGPNLLIELLKTGGVVSTIAAGFPTGTGGNGSLTWTIPLAQTPGTDYRIRVSSTINSSWTDTSNGNFSITAVPVPPSITVTSPNGGESWKRGTTHPIMWTYTGDPGPNVRVEGIRFTIAVPPAWFTIVDSTPIGSGGSGSYNWAIPASLTPANNYEIRVTSTTNSSYMDPCDGYFSIVP